MTSESWTRPGKPDAASGSPSSLAQAKAYQRSQAILENFRLISEDLVSLDSQEGPTPIAIVGRLSSARRILSLGIPSASFPSILATGNSLKGRL